MDKVNKPSTTLASIESKSNLLSIENLFTNESSSVLPSIVNVSESTEMSIDYFLKPGTFSFIVAPSSS